MRSPEQPSTCSRTRTCLVRIVLSLAGVGVLLSLGACQSVVTQCPPLVEYSTAQQKRLAAEIRTLDAGSVVGVAIADYHKLRNACRAAEAARAR